MQSLQYLLIQQLFVLSGITEQDVCQLGPHILPMEVVNLWEPEGKGGMDGWTGGERERES